jgi:hypothetical protein
LPMTNSGVLPTKPPSVSSGNPRLSECTMLFWWWDYSPCLEKDGERDYTHLCL